MIKDCFAVDPGTVANQDGSLVKSRWARVNFKKNGEKGWNSGSCNESNELKGD